MRTSSTLQSPLPLGVACMTRIIQSWPPKSSEMPGMRRSPIPGSGLPPTTVAKTMTAATTAPSPAAAASPRSTRNEAGDTVSQTCQSEGLGTAVRSVHLLRPNSAGLPCHTGLCTSPGAAGGLPVLWRHGHDARLSGRSGGRRDSTDLLHGKGAIGLGQGDVGARTSGVIGAIGQSAAEHPICWPSTPIRPPGKEWSEA